MLMWDQSLEGLTFPSRTGYGRYWSLGQQRTTYSAKVRYSSDNKRSRSDTHIDTRGRWPRIICAQHTRDISIPEFCSRFVDTEELEFGARTRANASGGGRGCARWDSSGGNAWCCRNSCGGVLTLEIVCGFVLLKNSEVKISKEGNTYSRWVRCRWYPSHRWCYQCNQFPTQCNSLNMMNKWNNKMHVPHIVPTRTQREQEHLTLRRLQEKRTQTS